MFSNGRHDELEPRTVPKPTQFQEISAKPEVPELSVVFDSPENSSKPSNRNPPYATSQTNTQETYSEWKNRQNRSPIHRETRFYEPRDKHYYGSSAYVDYDQNPYNHFSEKMSYKSGSECHKCAYQNTPTVQDIYSIMQIQNEQMKFLLETIQKLLVTVLTNQQNQHKCCCFENGLCKKDDTTKKTESFKNNEIQKECQLQHLNVNHSEKPPINLEKDEIPQKNKEPKTNSKCVSNQDNSSASKNKQKNSKTNKCDKINNSNDEKDNKKKEKERTFSVLSDESFDLNANDVQVIEAPISPDQSIHIEMKSSSEDSSNSECEEENDKKIEVGWTMYKNIVGQVNNLLQDNKSERKSEIAESAENNKPTLMTKPKNFEPYKHFILPENSKIDSSLQMQALAMQYLSPEQAVKFDMNKHFVPTTQQSAMKSPNNYSISTLHYMERYHLIGPEKNYTPENPQHKLSADGLLNKKKKSSRKNKIPSKILNITELKQQPKLS